jgi:hypothetical protein
MQDTGYPHSASLQQAPHRRARAKAIKLSPSQTWLDGLAVLFGLALIASVYLGWMSAPRAEAGDWDINIQSLD